jgi:peptide/nickel transport system substrate-binding protein
MVTIRRRLTRSGSTVFAALLAIALILGSAPSLTLAQASPEPQTGGRYIFALNGELTCFDPQISAGDSTNLVARSVVDSLVAQLPDGQLVPWLAKSWTASEDVTQFTFELETGITFSDGTPFNADAVKVNLDRIVNPETGSQYAISLLGPYESTTVVDDDTVQVNFSEGFSPFLQALSQPNLGIQSPTAIAAGTPCGPIVGSGPYTFSEVNPSESVVLARNENYNSINPLAQHEGPGYLDEIEFRYIPDDAVRVGSLSSEQVNAAQVIPPKDVQGLTDAGFTLLSASRPGAPYQIFINTASTPWDDVRVRQAFQKSLDITGIVETLYLGLYERAWSPLSPTTVGFDASLVDSWPQDVDAANALLDEAGWTWNGDFREKDGQKLVARWQFISTGRDQRELIAQLVKEQAKEVGIDVQIIAVGIAEYLQAIQNGDYDLGEFSFVRSDGDILRNLFLSTNIPSPERIAQNYSHVNDPQVDGWLHDAIGTLDQDARNAAYAQVQQWAITNAVVVPVYVQTELTVTAPGANGLAYDVQAFPLFYDAWLEQ